MQWLKVLQLLGVAVVGVAVVAGPMILTMRVRSRLERRGKSLSFFQIGLLALRRTPDPDVRPLVVAVYIGIAAIVVGLSVLGVGILSQLVGC